MTGKLPATQGSAPGGPGVVGLVDEVLDLLGGRSAGSRRLFGGVMAGAMIGAALAGFLLRPRPVGTRRRRD
jgi:hypothetical protein